jgi:tRNA acetyltransferase TAN1
MIIKNINLLISTSRYNEVNAKAELWFSLLICGDKYPIISNLGFPGLFSALSNIEGKVIISKLKEILSADPNFFQYILKIIPIDFICDLDIETISQIIEDNYKNYIKDHESFKISLKRRKSELIERNLLIESASKNVNNRVNLDNPDKIIRIELLGNFCGISFLAPVDILAIKNRSEDN